MLSGRVFLKKDSTQPDARIPDSATPTERELCRMVRGFCIAARANAVPCGDHIDRRTVSVGVAT